MVITEAGTEDAVKGESFFTQLMTPPHGHVSVSVRALKLCSHPGLVYICALAPSEGQSASVIAASPSSLRNDLEVIDGKLQIKDDAYHEAYCADLSDEATAHLRKTGRNPSASIMGEAVTAVGWKSKPSFYIVAADDKCILPENQDRMADLIDAQRIAKVEGASHAMHVGHPGEVGLFVASAARICKV